VFVTMNRFHPTPEAHVPYGTHSNSVHVRVPVAVLSAILFLSGIGALTFETLWLRLSGLAFGNSVWAAALILSSFMAGLALGNAIAASSRIRRWRPLHLYALLEVLVALLGCTIVFGLPVLGELLRPVWQMLWNYQPTLLGLRFVVSFLILLMPTTAMGLTLPVLMEDPMLRQTNFGRAIGFLYGSNTLGAVAGAVLGEGYLIEAFGLRGTSLAAGLASCVAAAAALLVAKFAGDTSTRLFQRTFPLRLDVGYRPPRRLLLVSFGTGCIFLCLEVIWFRFLRLYVASSSTAFAVMLAVVLAGIGLGSIVTGVICPRSARLNHLLRILLLLAAIATLLSYLFFPAELIQAPPTGVFDLRWWQIALLSIALMFPVALLSGILFPSIVADVQARVEDRMNSTGITTLFNTAGAATGPLLASFVLLPGVGYQWSLIFCAAGYALLSILAMRNGTVYGVRGHVRALKAATCRRTPNPSARYSMVLIGLWAAVIFLLAIFPYRRAQAHFQHASHLYEVDEQGHVLARVVKKIEGTSDTYQLLRRDLFGEPYYYRLLTNAFSMSATNLYSQRYMRLFAYLPLAFRPESEDVLLLCYGCGVTADALLHGKNIKRMDVVDISKEVFRLADFYSGINYLNPLRDPRVRAVVQDGRFFLQASPQQYDIITGEPPPPKVAGSVNLYTEEFFSLMNSRLKEGGIGTFWLPIGQLKVEESKAILRAFHNAFANASVWASGDQDWIMMGIKGPGHKVSEEELRRFWSGDKEQRSPVRRSEPTAAGEDLRRIGVEVPQQLGALFLMDGEEINRITRGIGPLTDNYPKRLTDEPSDDKASHHFALTYMEAPSALPRFLGSPLINRIWPETLNKSMKSLFAVRETRYLSETVGSNKLAELDLYLRGSRLRTPVLEVLGSDEFRLAIAERIASNSAAPSLEILPDLIAGALARRDIGEAVRLLEDQKARGMFSLTDTFLLTYLYCLNRSVGKAEELAANNAAAIKKDGFVDWLYGKLETDFGFQPPR
jgi:spermidine synthase